MLYESLRVPVASDSQRAFLPINSLFLLFYDSVLVVLGACAHALWMLAVF